MDDLISREKAINYLRNALYKYEDENEEKYLKEKESNLWFLKVRPSFQDMNDIDVQTLLSLPSESPWHTGTPKEEGWYVCKLRDSDLYETQYFKNNNWDEKLFEKWQKIEEN